MKKRILICAAYFHPHVGGYENYIYELYSRLVPYFDVDILVSDFQKKKNYEFYKGMNVYRLDSFVVLGNMYPIPKISYRNLKILKSIIKTKYSFVNTHTRFFLISLLGFIIARIKSTKLIHTEHGAGPIVFNNGFVRVVSKIYDNLIGKMIIMYSDICIGVSNGSCNYLASMGSHNIQLIQNGVDTTLFTKNNNNLKEKLGINNEYKVITFMGRLIYAKGVHDLINCFLSLKYEGMKIKLLIVGDGNYRSTLEKMAKNDRDIYFLGIRRDIVDIINISDVIVNPSYSEGLPTTILEAASVGIPVIATNVGGTKEAFIEEMGYLIEPNNNEELSKHIINILSPNNHFNEEISRQYIKNNYDWDIISQKFKFALEKEKK